MYVLLFIKIKIYILKNNYLYTQKQLFIYKKWGEKRLSSILIILIFTLILFSPYLKNSITAHATIDLGIDQTITTNTINLQATVTDDGLPLGSTLTYQWLQESGPGTVTFSTPNEEDTQATFPQPGMYQLRLEASDSEIAGLNHIVITVEEPLPDPWRGAGRV